MARRWHLAGDPRRPPPTGAGRRRQGAQPQCRQHRQPDGQGDRGGRGPGLRWGKKITGRKRPILVDTLGLVLVVLVTLPATDDGTTAPELLARLTAEHLS